MQAYDVTKIAGQFEIPGEVESGKPYGNGHINDTFLITTRGAGADRYILQRINHHVFQEPDRLMENVRRVTEHLRGKMVKLGRDPDRNSLTLHPVRGGGYWFNDKEGNVWRLYTFIRDSIGYDIVQTPEQAFEGGRAFGEFQGLLTDLPGGPLYETIPRFHDMELRLKRFREAAEADPVHRGSSVGAEIDWVEKRADAMTRFIRLGREGKLPERTTHNDTKFNNVLLDVDTDEAVCVIDLDTVMPGYVLYDFGDSIRTVTNTAAEDEADTSKIRVNLDLFRGYTAGYLSQAEWFLAPVEIENLAFSGIVMTFIIGLRFLTDHLDGDHYFKIHRPNHNLTRARAQFTLVESMERNLDEMRAIVDSCLKRR